MKKIFFLTMIFTLSEIILFGQSKSIYPEPEFSNELYYLKKDSTNTAVRLEKGSSKMDTKTKMGGMGGSESGYILDGEKSIVRLRVGNNPSFIISKGIRETKSSPQTDSMMRANGIEPTEMAGMMGSIDDPSNTVTLYKAESEKGKRKFLMQKYGGAMPFASKKSNSSDKYTFSVRKIRQGYWELVIDKTITKRRICIHYDGCGHGKYGWTHNLIRIRN